MVNHVNSLEINSTTKSKKKKKNQNHVGSLQDILQIKLFSSDVTEAVDLRSYKANP